MRERRLPNVLTLPAACVAVLGSLWTWFDGAPAPLIGAVLWTAVNGAAFLARGMGAGDVKLAPALAPPSPGAVVSPRCSSRSSARSCSRSRGCCSRVTAPRPTDRR
ncbi:A24 family peptidase [Tsukamurella sp. PLM1]|uniref:A24 family peptidase n=1 Tax=Tsukamurella sp. PLM1 TaxID=2929795 RepID=UPI00204D3515|nr:A24 family peptidase [Tsukamurella sp. PLM1]BDH57257.1 hypothetical protein MTP03_21960 [Tsukamurella sp. PLM1]